MQIINERASSQHDEKQHRVSLPVRNLQLPIMTWEIDGGREGAGDEESSQISAKERADGGYTEFRLVCFSLPLSVNVSFEFYSENRNCQSQFGFQAGKQLQLMLVWGGHHM